MIENKFFSGQHSDQLTRYMKIVMSVFMDTETKGKDTSSEYTKARGIFLTLQDEEPKHDNYAPIRYAAICEILDRLMISHSQTLAPEVETFLNHYLEIIKETAGMSDNQKDMESVARQLYRDHKKVLDFIVANGKSTDFTFAVDEVFGEGVAYPKVVEIEGQRLVYSNADSVAVSFLPESWFSALGGGNFRWPGCEKWWAGFPVIIWLHLPPSADGTKGQMRLYAEVGPLSDYAFRKDLIDKITEVANDKDLTRVGFQRGAKDEGKKYSRFFKKNSFPVDDIHDPDKIAATMRKAIRAFKDEFAAVADVFPGFIEHGKKDEQR